MAVQCCEYREEIERVRLSSNLSFDFVTRRMRCTHNGIDAQIAIVKAIQRDSSYPFCVTLYDVILSYHPRWWNRVRHVVKLGASHDRR